MYSDRDTLAGGLPHSEIPGSTIARISPGLFAACHVLHRLSVPRHPPDALTLRLSAAPNGKDHIRYSQGRYRGTRQTSRRSRRNTTFRRKRWNSYLARSCHRAANIPSSEDTLSRDPAAPPARQALTDMSVPAAHAVSRYGHTYSLLYDYQSAHAPAAQEAAPKQFLVFAASSRSPAARIGPATIPDTGGVEVIGIEPTTPCLQSRCSPS